MSLDLDSLRCFEAGATELHFGRAARRVGLSPSAFSDRIRRLEDALGAALFDRSTRHVTLTEAGHRLMPQAQACLRAALGCHTVLRGEAPPQAQTLVLGTRYELGMSWLVPALADLEAARPERRIHLIFGDSGSLLDHLLGGRADGAITSARQSHPRLMGEILHEERYTLVLSPALAAAGPLLGPGDLPRHVLLDLDGSLPLFRYFYEANPEIPHDFKGHQYLGTIAAVRHRALAGAGVAVLPTYFVAEDLAAGRLRAPFSQTPMERDHFRLIWRAGHPLTEALRDLAQALRALPLR